MGEATGRGGETGTEMKCYEGNKWRSGRRWSKKEKEREGIILDAAKRY